MWAQTNTNISEPLRIHVHPHSHEGVGVRIFTCGPGVDLIIELEEARALAELLTRVVENPAQYYNFNIGKPGYAQDSTVRVPGRDVSVGDNETVEPS
ncbi:hypothetical protein ACFTWF_03145 [Rhodococcus sp. NPDC056960]|uniref:hypothetical protein n=1 Tax=Rhodococcus sp. NPDC056960 TaxID=3345982 RepID=UPI003643AEBE